MPKEIKDSSVSNDRSRAYPYPCSSSQVKQSSSKNILKDKEHIANVKEWEEARCPVCLEHPHNAVLLLCSSHEKGCRPYMCDTSYRHSNCLDQFCKSSSETTTSDGSEQEEMMVPCPIVSPEAIATDIIGEIIETKLNLLCPLCRGNINGWIVDEPGRCFMNAKSRNCSCETCDFSGPYEDLRRHARVAHPTERPCEANPDRQRRWRRLERQRDLGDLISMLRSSFGEQRGGDDEVDSILPTDDGSWLTVYLFYRVYRPGTSTRSSSWSGTSRARARLRIRRSTSLWGESNDTENGSASPDEGNDSPDGEAGQPNNG